MQGLEAPDSILTLLDAIRTQIDVITALSSGALGAIILTWGRILGILDDADLSSFSRPGLLVVPATLLICAVTLGYLAGAQTTGYLTEIAQGVQASGSAITDAHSYYFASYRRSFDWMMQIQFITSLGGVLLLAVWFAWNLIGASKK